MDWDRKYPYGETLRSIFGSVSTPSEGIPKELTEQYLAIVEKQQHIPFH
jgi:penicillin-binding protein 3